jgi:hypothetical protein
MESSTSLLRLLDRLEAAKRQFGPGGQTAIAGFLRSLERRQFPDAASLIRLHESLLFFRAYPANEEILRAADRLLVTFGERVRRLERSGGDLEPFEEPDVSGISGTAFSAIFGFDITRWLVSRHPRGVDIDWDATDPELLGPLLVRLHPYFAEDSLVEANIPYAEWFRAAKKGRGTDLEWLVSRLGDVPAEVLALARIAVRWNLGDGPGTRSNIRLPGVRKFFFHDGPLLRRSDVSLNEELLSPPLEIERLNRTRGKQVLDLARETSAMRYRELHGFTYGDPAHVLRAQLGRGVEVFVCGVPREHRLPLRAYHAGMFFKNGVPLGYIECLTLFERMEVGFNLYYTFREGETAWLYARLLRLFRQLLGVSCFSVDPYQIGLHNAEAIESGAFWFYRKLGFRPVKAEVARLLEVEERKLRSSADYRTPASILRRLAKGSMIYEMDGVKQGEWDDFDVRRAAMALEGSPFSDAIARAKNGAQEYEYVRLLQEDRGLRQRLLRAATKQSRARSQAYVPTGWGTLPWRVAALKPQLVSGQGHLERTPLADGRGSEN